MVEYPKPFTTTDNIASYDGSGGATNRRGYNYGGDGGGIIWISSSDQMQLVDSNITSDGFSGKNNDGFALGSGGGAGGSIQIIAGGIKGNALITAKGGNGSWGAGGGGSGGRVIVNLLRTYDSKSYPAISQGWNGRFDILGGTPGAVSSSIR